MLDKTVHAKIQLSFVEMSTLSLLGMMEIQHNLWDYFRVIVYDGQPDASFRFGDQMFKGLAGKAHEYKTPHV
uniref:Uncharacterized protein n=1 Tax=Candidatus Kentrum sp. MB TaxID=2138164 RepID=A0A450XZW6_9GAMM|nr:MAG: hypothetical protein BECKMB1821G_GA0114241_100953 [Candidatus Kentron sp. MB]VFK34813.1 MAG: hypothetical protein BECKMB1821I_GA0114274_108515 [Candidatus Kentron sp. MB]VFK74185.1 MAG: hypothetical protein BECKMB1821H_GA0114242_10023 [Candidatus Kentron sp. MB]